MKQNDLAFYCGILGVLTGVLFVIIAGMAYPTYSHISQFISELSATGAPNQFAAKWLGFFPTGLFLVLFCLFAWRSLPKSILATLGFLVFAFYVSGYWTGTFFPCDEGCPNEAESFSQFMHNLWGGLGYLAGFPALVLIGIAARKWPNANVLSSWAIVGGIVGFFLMFGLDSDFAYNGLVQRIIEGIAMSWIILCALYVRKNAKT